MSFDLTNKNISDTFQNVLQVTGSDGNELFDFLLNHIVDYYYRSSVTDVEMYLIYFY